METATVTLLIIGIYMLPSLIAHVRRHRNRQALLAFNVFGGWTIFGWLAALVWSIYPEPSSYPRCERNSPWRLARTPKT